MPVEKSGQDEFDFQYGDDFPAHIEKFNPDFSKVLVRYNPDGDADMNKEQLARLKRLADWLHDNDRKFLFELLVPATDEQLASVGGDTDRYDAELRPELMRRAIEDAQNVGVEVDVWKIEGVDEQIGRRDARRAGPLPARAARASRAYCSVAARRPRRSSSGSSEAAPVEGFIGFAIGRSIWWDALKGYPRRGPRPRDRGQADRRQLPALREGLRRPGRSLSDRSAHAAG